MWEFNRTHFNTFVQLNLSKMLCLPEMDVLGDSEFSKEK